VHSSIYFPFQANFYLSEEELELARKGPGNVVCPQHVKYMEPLEFYCEPCDQAVCIRCKVTDHEGHKTEDLATTAERCVPRLKASKREIDSTVEQLSKLSLQSRESLSDATQKALAIKEHVSRFTGVIPVGRTPCRS
jgi:hypothetical protein